MTLYAPGSGLEPRDFDLVLYLFGDETLLTRSAIFIDWMKLTGSLHGAMDRPWHDVPTLMISFGYPYLLYDAPRVPTYINAYGTHERVQEAVLECLMGRAPFAGEARSIPSAGSRTPADSARRDQGRRADGPPSRFSGSTSRCRCRPFPACRRRGRCRSGPPARRRRRPSAGSASITW